MALLYRECDVRRLRLASTGHDRHRNGRYRQGLGSEFGRFRGIIDSIFGQIVVINHFGFKSQETEAHLELMENVVIDLLNAKWNTFIKFRCNKTKEEAIKL